MKIDLVVEQSGKTLGIDLERYRMLQRAGLTLFPLSYRAWRQDKAACLEAIRNWHQRLRDKDRCPPSTGH